MTTNTSRLKSPRTRVGEEADGSIIEVAGEMHALVYYGKGDYRVVPDRPIIGTAHDVIARVHHVHRCGTDVKIFSSGRPDQAEESLLEELAALIRSPHRGDSQGFLRYVRLIEDNVFDADFADPLYLHVADAVRDLNPDERAELSSLLRRSWGRIFGHEAVVEIVRVGSRVGELTQGIGYCGGDTLSPEYLHFQPGELCTVQSRVAHYQTPWNAGERARGVQLLGGNITDLAMNQAGAFAQYVRLRPQMIQSRSVLRIPSGVSLINAALVEPLGCLLDAFQKSAHEIGQDERGSILRKGVLPGGCTLIIGSGSMALMAGKLALLDDPLLEIGGARYVVFVVRSETKRALVHHIFEGDPRVQTVIAQDDRELKGALSAGFQPRTPDPYGRTFGGFDDVILAAGSAQTLAAAHTVVVPTGGRILAFAGTRGPMTIESGVWHYSNAALSGTSGCNTKMMEIGLSLLSRGALDLAPLSGHRYTFETLAEKGTNAFFEDQFLRPRFDPNEGVPPASFD